MKKNNFHRVMGFAGIAAGFCLVQGCSTMYSGSEAEDMRLRPLPSALEPDPVTLQTPTIRSAGRPLVSETFTQPVAMTRQQLTTSYTIQRGDTLSAIAYRYGLRWQDVAAVNPNTDPNKLYVGEVIQLPGKIDLASPVRGVVKRADAGAAASPAGAYTVKAGDSLSVIANRHGIKLDALRKANNLAGDKIIVGQKLTIPGAKPAAAPKDQAPKIQPPKTPVVPVTPVVAPTPAPTPALDPLEALPPLAPVDAAAPGAPQEPALPTPVAAILPAIPTAAAAGAFQNHTVGPDEDLYAVAIRWGVSTADIKAANNLTGSELVPGTVLKIPPVNPAP